VLIQKTYVKKEEKMTTANIIDEIKKALENYDGNWKEKKGVWEFSATIAERKVFLSKKKLTYTAKMRIDDGAKVVKFSEILIEAGSGFSSGGGFDDGMSTGFGFKTESYNTLSGARQGTIEEQSNLFGKEYSYHFDYKDARLKVEEVVEKAGYKFEYQILPVK
jgi:copper chaperone CopZ